MRRESAISLTLADANWPTASGCDAPLAAVGRIGAFDPRRDVGPTGFLTRFWVYVYGPVAPYQQLDEVIP